MTKAAEEGREALVRDLLTRGASVDAPDGEGNTPLVTALAQRRHDIMRILIEKGANVNCCLPHHQNPEGCTLLMFAAQRDDATAARMLIDVGAKVNSVFKGGSTALMVAITKSNLELVKMLLAAGADARAARPDGMTVLHMAVLSTTESPDGPGKDITLALLRAGADPNAWDKDSGLQGSPFHLLMDAQKSDGSPMPDLVRVMLEAGADVFAADNSGKLPIYFAQGPGFDEVCRLIIEFASGTDELFFRRSESFESDVKTILGEERFSALHASGLDEHNEVFCEGYVRALLANGAKAVLEHRSVGGNTPLMHVVTFGNHAVARVLIEAGANVQATNDLGMSPLTVAVALPRVEDARIVRMLLDAGADPIEGTGESSAPPMLSCVSSWIRALQGLEPAETIARTQARVDAIRMLVAAGADPDREYDQKMIPGVPTVSARTIAEFSGYSDIIIRALDDAVKLAETPTTARAAPAKEVDASSKKKCAKCAKTQAKMLQCRCRTGAYYCGKTCQEAHWPEHKAACRAAREAKKAKA